jgi:hypothetical protein
MWYFMGMTEDAMLGKRSLKIRERIGGTLGKSME